MERRAVLLSAVVTMAVACSAPIDPGMRRTGVADEGAGVSQSSVTGGNDTTDTRSTPVATPRPTSGCAGGAKSADQEGGLFEDQSITIRGSERTYDLEIPKDYDPTRPYPIVFVFHGSGGWASQTRIGFDFASVAGDKAIFVYPNGHDAEWDLNSRPDDNEDIALFDQLIEKLAAGYCVDSARVFATGFSNGAYFSNQLGCRRGNKLRAIASHGGGGPYAPNDAYDVEGHLTECVGPSPAALIVHGSADLVVGVQNVSQSLEHWTWANGCADGAASVSPSPCKTYGGCSAPVESCVIPAMGHMLWWEGTKVTWSFFSQL